MDPKERNKTQGDREEVKEVSLETEVLPSFPAPSVVDIRREATASFLAKAK